MSDDIYPDWIRHRLKSLYDKDSEKSAEEAKNLLKLIHKNPKYRNLIEFLVEYIEEARLNIDNFNHKVKKRAETNAPIIKPVRSNDHKYNIHNTDAKIARYLSSQVVIDLFDNPNDEIYNNDWRRNMANKATSNIGWHSFYRDDTVTEEELSPYVIGKGQCAVLLDCINITANSHLVELNRVAEVTKTYDGIKVIIGKANNTSDDHIDIFDYPDGKTWKSWGTNIMFWGEVDIIKPPTTIVDIQTPVDIILFDMGCYKHKKHWQRTQFVEEIASRNS